MNEYSIECIDNLRIHELRDFARKVGVVSPTTLKKDELIAKITEAVDGNGRLDLVGALPKTRRGIDFFALLMPENACLLEQMIDNKNNPSVSFDKFDKELNGEKEEEKVVFKPVDDSIPYDAYPESKPLFSFSIRQNEAFYDVSEVVEGYLQLHPTGYGIVRSNGYLPSINDIYLSCDLVRKHQLKSGDKVKGRAKVVIEDKPKIMFEVISVDGNPGQAKLQPFEMGKHNGMGDSFYFDRFNINIKKGERVYIKNLDYKYAMKLAEDLIDDNEVNVKVLNVRAVPEDNINNSKNNLEVINCPFNMIDNNVINALDLILDRVKREYEDNKPNVLVVYNFSGLIRVLNTAIDGYLDYNRYDMRAINKILDILYSAKFVDNTHHFSVVFIDKNEINPIMNSVFETEFKPLFNTIIDASDNGFFN